MSAPLLLAARLDLGTARLLYAALLARRDDDLVLDAGHVSHFGTLALQLLLAAARSWRRDGNRLAITPRSPAFDDALQTFGVALDDLQAERAA